MWKPVLRQLHWVREETQVIDSTSSMHVTLWELIVMINQMQMDRIEGADAYSGQASFQM